MVELIWESDGIVRRFSGTVSAEEMNASAVSVQSDARFDDLRYIIHDFTACCEVSASEDDLEFMAARASYAVNMLRSFKIVFVGDHAVVRNLVRIFNQLGISSHPCVFVDSLEEARAFVSGKA